MSDQRDIFVVGGTLRAGDPSYVTRPTDQELLDRILAGEFCYVLAPRQMGKSSLMVHAAVQLRAIDIKPVIVDLSSIGIHIPREQWYMGLIYRLARDLRLSIKSEQWWEARPEGSPEQGFVDFLHDIVLAEVEGPVIIFIDEIDTTLALDFRDEFFAAIRAMYDARASDPKYSRLTFVVLGVAIPEDLISDTDRSPFSIGKAIDLQSFSRQDAQPLEGRLEEVAPGMGRTILDRIFYWTGGHPCLTQRMCRAAVRSAHWQWSDAQVDRLATELFLSEQVHRDDNIRFVQDIFQYSSNRRLLLQLYQRIYEGQIVVENRGSSLQNRPLLTGLVRGEGGVLPIPPQNSIQLQEGIFSAFHDKLPMAKKEVEALGAQLAEICSCLGMQLKFKLLDQTIAADVLSPDQLIRLMVSDDFRYGLVHLACHCINPQDSGAAQAYLRLTAHGKELEIRLERLQSVQSRYRFVHRPFVFLNACESATPGHLLQMLSFPTGILGFGAGGVIATACSMPDNFASAFADAFYKRLLDRARRSADMAANIGEALLETRCYFLQEHNNPLGLAYGLYAMSNQQLRLGD